MVPVTSPGCLEIPADDNTPLRWIISERTESASSAVELSVMYDFWLQKEMVSSSGPVREDCWRDKSSLDELLWAPAVFPQH